EHLVERIKQSQLIRARGYVPVTPRQPGKGNIGSPADRQRGNLSAALGDPGDIGKPSKNRRGPRREKQSDGDSTRPQAVDWRRPWRGRDRHVAWGQGGIALRPGRAPPAPADGCQSAVR